MGLLLLAFIATPIIEIALFIQAGERFGLWPTLAVVVLTAFAGTVLLRWQGLATWRQAVAALQRNEFPVDAVFSGLCLVLAGALLLTPGFMTDAIGLALFVPPVRRLLARALLRYLQRHGETRIWVDGEPVDPFHRDDVIDGDYETLDPDGPHGPHEAPPEIPDQRKTPPGSGGSKPGGPKPGSPWRKDR